MRWHWVPRQILVQPSRKAVAIHQRHGTLVERDCLGQILRHGACVGALSRPLVQLVEQRLLRLAFLVLLLLRVDLVRSGEVGAETRRAL